MKRLLLAYALATSQFVNAQETPPAAPGGGSSPPNESTFTDWKEVEKLYSQERIDKLPESEAKSWLNKIVAAEGSARKDALADFKQGAGLGFAVVLNTKKSVEDAEIVDHKVVVTKRSKDVPRATLEVHQLFTTNVFTTTGRKAAQKQLLSCEATPIDCPMFGVGPYAALQTGSGDAVASLGIGLMVGVRNDPRKEASFNLGVGLAWDSGVRTLAKGFEEGTTLADGVTDVKFDERSARRLMISVSFGF